MKSLLLSLVLSLLIGSFSHIFASEKTPVIVSGNNAFAMKLYGQLKADGKNLFISPYSISTALAMTYAGARHKTETEMGRVLGFRESREKIHQGFMKIIADTNSIEEKGAIELAVANSLWAQYDYVFERNFVDILNVHYGTKLNLVDYKTAPKEAETKINTWVLEKTKEKIDNIIPTGSLTPATRLILVNAIYFKGDWKNTFQIKQTRDKPFWLNSDKSVDTPMMRQRKNYNYAENETLKAIELPYEGDDVSMIIFLPKSKDGLVEMENRLVSEGFDTILSNMRRKEVDLLLPKFKLTYTSKLKGTLEKMGMKDAFDPKKADFTGINNKKDLFISEVIHKAFVAVDEKGTEAAAATAVMLITTDIAERPKTFQADHPFVFMIRENHNNSILFLGRIADPTEGN